MPSFLFLLLRYFLRVDGVLLRSNETRLYHQTGTDYLLREYSSRETWVSELQHVPPAVFSDPAEISQLLALKDHKLER
uniref:TIP41-like protein n=1 Tax=Petromyzon marinus TaxID=7757 RepID=A0AAJ7UI83_PETMA|nr:TIP41-like protein [Petromyzon marinus]